MGPLDPTRGGCGPTSRRAFLHVGYSGLVGIGLPGLLAARAAAATGSNSGRARSVIVILLSGGLGQHDSFDMKPEAPDGIRGEFKPIDTAVPGIRICEHLPGLAARIGRLAIVRSMSHPEGNHLVAVHRVLTGHPSNPRGAERPRSGGVARRLPLLRGRARPAPPPERRHPERRGPADPPGRGAAHLAGPGRRLPRAPARPLAAPPRPESPRGPRRQPRPARRARPRRGSIAAATCWASPPCRRPATPSSISRTPLSPCSATAAWAGRWISIARTRGSSTATAGTSSAGRCSSRGGWSRPACRSCRRRWGSSRPGTPTSPTSPDSATTSCLRWIGRSRPCSTTSRSAACSTRRWW